MWLMLQQDKPDDYVVATGRSHSVREFLDASFSLLDLEWRDYVRFDPRYLRPTEIESLQGDPSKAWKTLGWRAEVTMPQLARMIVESDLNLAREECNLRTVADAAAC